MNISQLQKILSTIEDQTAPVYVMTDDDPMEAELSAVQAREVVPFKPFWSNVQGYILQ
jgi:hypothetical protein